jgi:hypothetical protein
MARSGSVPRLVPYPRSEERHKAHLQGPICSCRKTERPQRFQIRICISSLVSFPSNHQMAVTIIFVIHALKSRMTGTAGAAPASETFPMREHPA